MTTREQVASWIDGYERACRTAVRVEVRYAGPSAAEYSDLWVIRFAEDGRCRAFEEWPFWPGQPLSAARAPIRPDRAPSP